MAFLPSETLHRIQSAAQAGRLAHAYLLTGSTGSGKSAVARDIAKLILEVSDSSLNQHPDFHEVRPESKSRRILIEQIRNLEAVLQRKALLGRKKVAVIYEADRILPAAANAFLKTLEEPPEGVHILLVSSIPELMLETILSRCIEITLRSVPSLKISAREERIMEAINPLLKNPSPSIADVFTAIRIFSATLAEARTEIATELDTAFRLEREHYKNTTDGSWLSEREEQIKASTESATLRERSRLLEVILKTLSTNLKICSLQSENTPQYKQERAVQLRRIEAFERMRSDLEHTINETLALEAGFLNIFLPRT